MTTLDLFKMYQWALSERIRWFAFCNEPNIHYRVWLLVERKLEQKIVARLEVEK